MQQTRQIFSLLADGKFHSGEEIGSILGVTRSAVWKTLARNTQRYGIEIESVRGRGYRIPGGIEFLDEQQIKNHLSTDVRAQLSDIALFESVDSTNTQLLEQAKHDGGQSGLVYLAEQQTHGRGRRGREWFTPYASNIALSLLWQFANGPSALAGLSLVVGISVVKALQRYGLNELGLKWPNDVLWHQRKLAGILVEMFVDGLGVCHAVIGVGLNLKLPESTQTQITQPWTDIETITGQPVQRNKITALILDELLCALPRFEEEGFSGFLSSWQMLDVLNGKEIKVLTQRDEIHGIAQGVDELGGLQLNVNGQAHVFSSGEVSVRL